MIDVNDLRKGVTFELDGQIFKVLEYSHNKPGRGNATIRTKLYNLRSGANIERTFQSGDRVQDIRLDHHQVQFLYKDGELYYFMDNENYEQTRLTADQVGEARLYLTENMNVEVLFFNQQPVAVEVPLFVELEVAQTEPGVKGDTAAGGTKPATLESGVTIQVPLFINEGDRVKVDTRTGSYIERVK